MAKVRAGDPQWRRRVRKFTTFADDVVFLDQSNNISHVPERLWGDVNRIVEVLEKTKERDQTQSELKARLEVRQKEFLGYVDQVPIAWEPVVFEANTPFTAYLRLREVVMTARKRFHYFDAYLKPDFFVLYLESLGRNIEVRLVTTAKGTKKVKAASALASQEFADYQLIEVPSQKIHDRNLRVDEKVFSLGPGADRAGMKLTNFGPAESSVQVHEEFDRLIQSGKVVHDSTRP